MNEIGKRISALREATPTRSARAIERERAYGERRPRMSQRELAELAGPRCSHAHISRIASRGHGRRRCTYTGEPDEFEQPVYECSRCGGTQVGAENRKCETDHIFMARVGDLACPSCEDALEADPVLVTGVVVDGEFIPEAELEAAP